MNYFLEIKNRICIIVSTVIFLIISQLYFYKSTLLFLCLKPHVYVKNSSFYLICTDITEGFLAHWYIIWIISLHFCFFFGITQIYLFISPGLYRIEKKLFKFYLFLYIIFGVFFFLIFYMIILPFSWNFFYNLCYNNISPQLTIDLFFEIKVNDYLNFYFTLYFICFFLSQLIFLLSIKLNLVYQQSHFKTLKKHRNKIYFILFFLSTLVTPPDVASQIVIGCLLVLLLEIIIFFIIFLNKF